MKKRILAVLLLAAMLMTILPTYALAEAAQAEETPAVSETAATQTGWVKKDNKWYYYDSYGIRVTGWKKISGKWYYFKDTGIMATGWQKVSGKWYYLNGSGAMVTGWKKISGKWYYLKSSGAMATGWQKVSGKWYYLKTSGAMACNETLTIDGLPYTFDANGICPVYPHTWNSGRVTKKATCTASGVKIYTCTSCGQTKTVTLPALGHDWQPDGNTYIYYQCSNCSYWTQNSEEMGFHSAVNGGHGYYTCTGAHWYLTCSHCGDHAGSDDILGCHNYAWPDDWS